jgi:spermidine/putrescine transport system ATP-binding protein
MQQPDLEARGVGKRYPGHVAVDDLSFAVARGSFFSILGPSGCGKTTLLRMIAGFLAPDSGEIRIGGAAMAGVPPNKRPVNMVFQHLALFPMMSVGQNVGYGLARRGMPARDIEQRVGAMLERVSLPGAQNKRIDQLSGGQKQRVAIARALATNPRILLCDEATSALDPHTALSILRLLKQLNRERGMTMVLVTHDIKVASYLCEQSLVLEKGRVVDRIDMQSAAPQSLLGRFFFETSKGWTDSTVLPQEDA